MTKLIGAIAPGGGPAVELSDVLAALTTGEKAALLTALLQGSAGGLPGPLNGSGQLPAAQLPPLAVNEVYTVASQAAMLALSANVGDVAVRTDLSPHETFMLAAAPASTLGNWVQVTADSGAAAIAEAYTDTAISGLAGVYLPFSKPSYGHFFTGPVAGQAVLIDDPSGTYGTGVLFGNAAGFGFTGAGTPSGIFAPLIVYQRYGDSVGGTNAAVLKTTQGVLMTTAYYGPSTEDAAEGVSSAVLIKDTGTGFTQPFPVTGYESDVQIEGANVVSSTAGHGAYCLGQGSRIVMKGTSHTDLAYGNKVHAEADQNGTSGATGTIDTWRGFFDDLYNPAGTLNHSVYGYNAIHSEQRLTASRSGYSASIKADLSGGDPTTSQALLTLQSPSPATTRTVTDAAITSGSRKVTSATAAWSIPADIGKKVTVAGAGAAGVTLTARLLNAVGTTAWLDVAASTTVSGASLTIAEPDVRGLRLIAGTGQTQAHLETYTPDDGTGTWNFRVNVAGAVSSAGSGASWNLFRNVTDASPGFQVNVNTITLRDYPLTSPTTPYKIVAGTSFGLQLLTATNQLLGFWGTTGTAQPAASKNPRQVLSSVGLVAGSGTDGLAMGFCPTFTGQPGIGALALAASNNAGYYRVYGAGSVSKVAIHVGTSSGNISVAAYRASGTGRSAVPGTQLATSGAVACPGTGYQEVSLGSTVTLNEGDFIALSCDNTTATFMGVSGSNSNLALGMGFIQTSAHPLPSTPSSLTASFSRAVHMAGV